MAGFSNVSSDETIMFADNASFNGDERSGKLTLNGQLWIGSTASPHVVKGTITAGSGITVTNGSGTIQISASGGSGLPTWTDQGSNTTLAVNNAYFATAAVTLTLPAAPVQGDTVWVYVDTASTVVVTANTGQFIRDGVDLSSSAGTATNTFRGDCLQLFYRTADTTWMSIAGFGNWNLA